MKLGFFSAALPRNAPERPWKADDSRVHLLQVDDTQACQELHQ